MLAANGSGAVKLSRNPHQTVLNVDIGGGTTKFALVKDGRVAQTATVNVGGRLVATGADGSITRVEEAAHTTADAISVPLSFGEPLSDQSRIAIADALGEVIIDVIQGRPRSELTQALLLTPDMPADMAYDALVFSGGVSEYIYGNETKDFGDLAMALADAVSRKMAENALPAPRTARDGAHQGYGDRCVAIHGSVERQHALHLRHVASAVPERAGAHLESCRRITRWQPEEVAALVNQAFERQDLTEGEQQVSLAFDWDGLPRYSQIRKIADGIVAAMPRSLANGSPLMLVFTGDFAKLIGETITKDIGITNPVISIDNLFLQEFDYIDIGEMIYPARVVPVVVKSLLFPEIEKQTAEVLD